MEPIALKSLTFSGVIFSNSYKAIFGTLLKNQNCYFHSLSWQEKKESNPQDRLNVLSACRFGAKFETYGHVASQRF